MYNMLNRNKGQKTINFFFETKKSQNLMNENFYFFDFMLCCINWIEERKPRVDFLRLKHTLNVSVGLEIEKSSRDYSNFFHSSKKWGSLNAWSKGYMAAGK